MNPIYDTQFAAHERAGLTAASVVARGAVVNRTHRVVRERALAMQQRRNRARSLMAPMMVSSALLILSVLAVWTGMYQYQAVEAVESDVTSIASADLSNHVLVMVLWFVPVSIALLATLWVRRSRRGRSEDEAR